MAKTTTAKKSAPKPVRVPEMSSIQVAEINTLLREELDDAWRSIENIRPDVAIVNLNLVPKFQKLVR